MPGATLKSKPSPKPACDKERYSIMGVCKTTSTGNKELCPLFEHILRRCYESRV